METKLQLSGYDRQHALMHDLVIEMLKMDDDATELAPAVLEKRAELKQLSIELQRKPYEEPVEAADAGTDFWAEIARKVIEAGVQYVRGWFEPGRTGALFNDTNDVITVLTYDQRDFLHWVPYARYTIGPRKPAMIAARGDTYFQADIRGKIHNIRIGGQHVFTGATVISR